MPLAPKAVAILALALSLFQPIDAAAQTPPAKLPPGVYAGERDYKLAATGTYALDPSHASIVAKVAHIGYSYSVFRFDAVDGVLTWNPAAPTKSTLKVSVRTASISTSMPGFAAQIASDGS